MKTPVSRIAPGKVISYRGEPCIVLEHRKDGTLLVTAEAIQHTFGKTNNFKDKDSSLRVHLNGSFLDSITQGHPEEVIPPHGGPHRPQRLQGVRDRGVQGGPAHPG